MKYLIISILTTVTIFAQERVNRIDGNVARNNQVDIRNAKSVSFDRVRGNFYEKIIQRPSNQISFTPFNDNVTPRYVDFQSPIDGLRPLIIESEAPVTLSIYVSNNNLNNNADSFLMAFEGNLSRAAGNGGNGGEFEEHWAIKTDRLLIEYIGGTNQRDAREEAYKTLSGSHFMPRYMLKITATDAPEDARVTWTIRRGNANVGTYHENGRWIDYDDPLAQQPTSRIIYWRSDLPMGQRGTLAGEYEIAATWNDDGQNRNVERSLMIRQLNPNVADLRDNFSDDTDMYQRAVIQIFGLNKGRMDSYDIGEYRDNAGNSFYNATDVRISDWSKIADEISNIDTFIIGSNQLNANNGGRNASSTTLHRQVQAIWAQFDLILAAGDIGAVDTTHANFNNWLNNAVVQNNRPVMTNLPNNLGRTAQQVLNALMRTEHVRAVHSYQRHDPLAVNSVRVGTNAAGRGAAQHQFTDWGIGFGAIQPYNANGNNLYIPEENLRRMAEILNNNIRARFRGTRAKLWYAAFLYNAGPGNLPANPTMAGLRTGNQAQRNGANYADRFFGHLDLAIPANNNQ